jgi:hypothetical protein
MIAAAFKVRFGPRRPQRRPSACPVWLASPPFAITSANDGELLQLAT